MLKSKTHYLSAVLVFTILSLSTQDLLANSTCIKFYDSQAVVFYERNQAGNLPTLPFVGDKGSIDSFYNRLRNRIPFTRDAAQTSEIVYKGTETDVADKFNRSVLIWGKSLQGGVGEGYGYSDYKSFTFTPGQNGNIWGALYSSVRGLQFSKPEIVLIQYLDEIGTPTLHLFKSPLLEESDDGKLYIAANPTHNFSHFLKWKSNKDVRVIDPNKIVAIKAYFWRSGGF